MAMCYNLVNLIAVDVCWGSAVDDHDHEPNHCFIAHPMRNLIFDTTITARELFALVICRNEFSSIAKSSARASSCISKLFRTLPR